MCVDFSRLNRYVKRKRYQSQTPAEAVASISANEEKYFTVIDAAKKYLQCPLDDESQLYTTFITPFGHLRVPYGLSSIAEHYNCCMAEAFGGLLAFRRIVDDMVIYGKDKERHIAHVKQFLQRYQDRQISLNRDKCTFCQTTITFTGFKLSPEGYCIDSSIIDAVSSFPAPSSRSDLRSFFGLINQLSSCTDTIAALLGLLRPLLSTKNDFLWSPKHKQAFRRAKEHLTTVPTLAYFSVNKPT